MADILIRDIPDAVLVVIDAKAKRLGISRSEYLRRALDRERPDPPAPLTIDQLARLADRTADLDDAAVMGDAWS